MTPKEKAEELVQQFIQNAYQEDGDGLYTPIAKQCALITINEIIILHKGKFMCEREEQNEEYWQEVKQEINQL
jgi:hypothetical protein